MIDMYVISGAIQSKLTRSYLTYGKKKNFEEAGYNSVEHFSRTFKKYYKKSPQQYRRHFSKYTESFYIISTINKKSNT